MYTKLQLALLSILFLGCRATISIPGSLHGLGRSPSPYFVQPAPSSPYTFPVHAESYISSPFGMRQHPIHNKPKMHNGVDIAAPKGTPIYPIAKGKTIFAGYQKGYGKVVYVDHGKGVISRYAHCHTLNTNNGETVHPNTKIATIGKTGSATGYHLHLEIRKEDIPQDPLPLIHVPSQE